MIKNCSNKGLSDKFWRASGWKLKKKNWYKVFFSSFNLTLGSDQLWKRERDQMITDQIRSDNRSDDRSDQMITDQIR